MAKPKYKCWVWQAAAPELEKPGSFALIIEGPRDLELIERQKNLARLIEGFLNQTAKAAAVLLVVVPAIAYAQQPWGRPYAPPPPPPYTRGALPAWVPPTVPAGDPSLRIPMPAPTPPPAPWPGYRP